MSLVLQEESDGIRGNWEINYWRKRKGKREKGKGVRAKESEKGERKGGKSGNIKHTFYSCHLVLLIQCVLDTLFCSKLQIIMSMQQETGTTNRIYRE